MTSRFIDHLLEGDHASRPAFGSVPQGALYACSTHGLIYQSDGSTAWSTWATLGGGAPAAHAASHEDGGSDEIDVTGLVGAGGGGGGGWTLLVDQDGSSIAAWTALNGTWSATGGKILADNDGVNTYHFLRYDTKVPFGLGVVVEAELLFPTSGQGAGLDVIGGMALAHQGTTGLGMFSVDFYVNRDWCAVLTDASVIRRTYTPTLNLDTAYTLRVALNGPFWTVWVAGTLLGSGELGRYTSDRVGDYFSLYSYNSRVEFDNIKVWHTTAP